MMLWKVWVLPLCSTASGEKPARGDAAFTDSLKSKSGYSSVGGARDLGSRGRWFETSYSDHKKAHTATLEDFLADNRKYISALPLLETLTATSNFYT